MRIVAGHLRGKRIAAPEGGEVRPTGERTREALFNLLTQGRVVKAAGIEGNPLIGATVLDAFAGTGALGLEAYSRGAETVLFVEKDPQTARLLRQNIAALGAQKAAMITQADATQPPPAPRAANIVVMDPPYGEALAGPALVALARRGWLAEGAIVAVELAKTEDLDPPEGFTPLDERRYGKSKLVFFVYR